MLTDPPLKLLDNFLVIIRPDKLVAHSNLGSGRLKPFADVLDAVLLLLLRGRVLATPIMMTNKNNIQMKCIFLPRGLTYPHSNSGPTKTTLSRFSFGSSDGKISHLCRYFASAFLAPTTCKVKDSFSPNSECRKKLNKQLGGKYFATYVTFTRSGVKLFQPEKNRQLAGVVESESP